MNYVVKIVLDCSNDLKVKKTPRCTAESHKSVVSNSRLWAGRLLRGRQAQSSRLLCSFDARMAVSQPV